MALLLGILCTTIYSDQLTLYQITYKRQCFYRAMHFSAKRGIAIACRLSVHPSVCLSVCNVGEL